MSYVVYPAAFGSSGGGGGTNPFTPTNISSNVSLANLSINFVDTSSARTLTLPAPVNGALIYVKDSTGSATTNNITIAQNASEKIEGLASGYVMRSSWDGILISSNGTDWFLL